MTIGLIDVDSHHFPNLALMKISAYHKSIGDTVEWWEPNRECYDIVYMSKIFSDTYTQDVPEPLNAKVIKKGGTGYAIKTVDGKEIYSPELDMLLPSEIEHIYPDYSLYPEYTGYGKPLRQQTAYGFLTRGCPRGCDFCIVGAKEGRCARKVADLSEFWNGQGNICLSDPNILACADAPELLQQLIDCGAKVDFNQGLDARLITRSTAELLAQVKIKTPHFAMDSMADIDRIKKGIGLYVEAYKKYHGKWIWRNAKVFMLTNFNTTHEEDMRRIKAIQEINCVPFVMIYNKPSAPAITRRLQRWANCNYFYESSGHDFYKFQSCNYKYVLHG